MDFERPPRWFDRLMCFIGWALLILMGHCAREVQWGNPNGHLKEIAPVTAPDAGGRPGW